MSATVVAKGDSALGVWPHMLVRVDGAVVGDAFVTSDDWAPYTFDFDASAGPQDVRIEFDNDYYDPPEHDRNLYVDRVTIACAPTCNDDLTNGTETDTDCGGGECPTCPDGSTCALNADCESENCSGGVCEAGHYLYDFESGTAGWTWVESPAIGTTTSTLHAFDGAKSLKVSVAGSGDPRVWTSPPEPVPSGATVTFRVYIPTSAPVTALQPYVADAAWQWSQSWYAVTGAMKGSWQTFAVTVDLSAETPVQELGIKAYLSGSYTGPIYVDGVEW